MGVGAKANESMKNAPKALIITVPLTFPTLEAMYGAIRYARDSTNWAKVKTMLTTPMPTLYLRLNQREKIFRVIPTAIVSIAWVVASFRMMRY